MDDQSEDLRGPSPWSVAAIFKERGGTAVHLFFTPRSGMLATCIALACLICGSIVSDFLSNKQLSSVLSGLGYVLASIRLLMPLGTDQLWVTLSNDPTYRSHSLFQKAEAAKYLQSSNRAWRVTLWISTRPFARAFFAALLSISAIINRLPDILGTSDIHIDHPGYLAVRFASGLGFVAAMVLPFFLESASRHRALAGKLSRPSTWEGGPKSSA